jgi:hypothetical protein
MRWGLNGASTIAAKPMLGALRSVRRAAVVAGQGGPAATSTDGTVPHPVALTVCKAARGGQDLIPQVPA